MRFGDLEDFTDFHFHHWCVLGKEQEGKQFVWIELQVQNHPFLSNRLKYHLPLRSLLPDFFPFFDYSFVFEWAGLVILWDILFTCKVEWFCHIFPPPDFTCSRGKFFLNARWGAHNAKRQGKLMNGREEPIWYAQKEFILTFHLTLHVWVSLACLFLE